MHEPESTLMNESLKNDQQTDHQISVRRPNLVLIYKKERIYHRVNYAVSVNHKVKIKESYKVDNYLDIARELKSLWNMKVVGLPIVVDAQGTVTKGQEKRLGEQEIRERIDTIQTTSQLKSDRILTRLPNN